KSNELRQAEAAGDRSDSPIDSIRPNRSSERQDECSDKGYRAENEQKGVRRADPLVCSDGALLCQPQVVLQLLALVRENLLLVTEEGLICRDCGAGNWHYVCRICRPAAHESHQVSDAMDNLNAEHLLSEVQPREVAFGRWTRCESIRDGEVDPRIARTDTCQQCQYLDVAVSADDSCIHILWPYCSGVALALRNPRERVRPTAIFMPCKGTGESIDLLVRTADQCVEDQLEFGRPPSRRSISGRLPGAAEVKQRRRLHVVDAERSQCRERVRLRGAVSRRWGQ